jgi:hypothetical protein
MVERCLLCALGGERGEGSYMGEIQAHLDVLFIEFRVLWCSRKEGG